MSSTYGHKIRLSVFGQSHSEKIGVVIDGLPVGFKPDMEALATFCARRTSVGKAGTTPRKEQDLPHIVSGLFDGATCGAPLAVFIDNTDVQSSDYSALKRTPRPSHADYPAEVKYEGFQDHRGGGHFSGRLTAPLVFAGGLCKQLLEQQGVLIGARVKSIGTVEDLPLDAVRLNRSTLENFLTKPIPCHGDPAGLQAEILAAQSEGDSVGGTIECFALGLPCGVGEPFFDSLESRISALAFSVPAVKGIEFGTGFALSRMRGSAANDPYYFDGDTVKTRTNHNGGILGGLSTGMPIQFTVAMKPTPSIAKEQQTVDLQQQCDTTLSIGGRHDPCVVVRAVPCIESVAAIALCEFLL